MSRLSIVIALGLAGCGAPPSSGNALGEGALLRVDHLGGTDVQGFHLEVTQVSCGSGQITPFEATANVDLRNGEVSGGLTILTSTLDPSSGHLASELFLSLRPGCYDIVAAPAASFDPGDPALWTPSADCDTASVGGARVHARSTTDVNLLSQCRGDSNGGIDVLVALNHPPTVSLAVSAPHAAECEPVTVCATAVDPDDDPLSFDVVGFGQAGEFRAESSGAPEVIGWEAGHRVWESCWTIVDQDVGEHAYEILAYDMTVEGDTIESLVSPAESHDAAPLAVYTAWAETPACNDNGVLVPYGDEIVRDPGCDWNTAAEWYCGADGDASNDPFLCGAKGELLLEAAYPACDEPPAVSEVGLLAWYPMSGDANDASGAGNDGTVFGASLAQDRFGASGAYQFGTGLDIAVPNSASLQSIQTTGAMTVAAWVYVDSWDGVWFPVVEFVDGWELHLQGGTAVSVGLSFNSVGIGTWAEVPNAVAVGSWHHVAVTFDDPTDDARFYVDGALIDQQAFGEPLPAWNAEMRIGSSPFGGAEYAHGRIDELRIYDRVLAPGEVATLAD